jgi:LAO/AO transport system kinase
MKKQTGFRSALSVTEGVKQPPSVNKDAVSRFRMMGRKKYSIDEYVNGILKGDRIVLSRAITLVESSLASDHRKAQEIIEKCLPHSGKSIRIGITGVPGVGKSTFIESLGKYVISKKHTLAVLAIDPSSQRSKGSILGDKTRMEDLSADSRAYIRPSPSAGTLGGVARKTHETIILCEAAGFDVIFIETVGVGQSETAVHSMVDYFLLLMLAGAGDELQGIKRGIMEMADSIVITKADGNNISKTEQAKTQYQHALHLFPIPESKVLPAVITCSSLKNKGIEEAWQNISSFISQTKTNGYFHQNRKKQNINLMHETLRETLYDMLYNNRTLASKIKSAEKAVLQNKISSYMAAKKLMDSFIKNKR